MAFDPSTIADIGANTPDVPGSMAKAFTLKDMIDTEQLNKLKLVGAKQEQEDNQALRKLASKSDLSTQKGISEYAQKAAKINPSVGMEAIKFGQSVSSGERQAQLDELQIHSQVQDTVVSSLGNIVSRITPLADEKKPDGTPKYDRSTLDAMTMGQLAKQVADIQNDDTLSPAVKKQLQGRVQQFMSQGQPTFDSVNKAYQQSKQGQAQLKAHMEQLNTQSEIAARESTAAHQKVEERQGQQRLGIEQQRANLAKQNAGDFGGSNGELLAAMTDAGVTLPQGLRSKQVLAGTLTALRERHPDMDPDQIAAGVKDGSISMGIAKTEGSVLGRREAAILPVEKSITKAGGFLDQAEKAVNEVDFSKLKAAGHFENWKADQLSDPKLAAYKAAVAELRAEYSIVLSKGGQVTDAARHESEKVIPDLITKDQFKRIKQVVLSGIESSKGGVEESIAGVTGKGGGSAPAAGDIRAQADAIIGK